MVVVGVFWVSRSLKLLAVKVRAGDGCDGAGGTGSTDGGGLHTETESSGSTTTRSLLHTETESSGSTELALARAKLSESLDGPAAARLLSKALRAAALSRVLASWG